MMNPIYKFFLNKGSGNEIAPGLMSKGVVLDTTDGSTTSNASYQTTAFMAVTATFQYLFRSSSNQPTTIPYYAWYNKNKAFISGGTGSADSPVTAPTGAAFIRISFSSSFNAADYSFARSSLNYNAYVSEQAFPMYRDDLAKTYDKELNEQFFRTGLSGELTFVSKDYDWIVAQAFDFKFLLTIYISQDAGQTWEVYWTGVFYKTDCTFDGFAKTVAVTPEVYDQYTDLLPVLDKEFNIDNLVPEIRRTWIDKPGVLQFYNAGDSVITCVIPGRSWEEECDAVNANETVGGQNKLTGYLHFALLSNGVYARLLTDAATISGSATYDLPSDDIVTSRRTHNKVRPYTDTASFTIGEYLTTTPTKYGMYDDTYYYAEPPGTGHLPIVRNKWTSDSYWFTFSSSDLYLMGVATTNFELLLNYNIGSVLRRLMSAVDVGLDTTTISSIFFATGTNPISGDTNMPITISPKSNVMAGSGLSYYAQKGELSLRDIFDMFRDCFRCYWFIDGWNILHIEHIKYFMNGGSYDRTPGIGRDLLALLNPRSDKSLAYGQQKYKFDKPSMPTEYDFAWMDEVTQPFTGYPIEIDSNYVDKSRRDEIKVAKFTTDLDFLMLSTNVDRDGFALMNIVEGVPFYKVPYWNNLQNGYFSFDYLQQFYAWDMPARHYSINGVSKTALGTKKLKMQEIDFPAKEDPDTTKLIRTLLGYGVIEKMSVSLSSRNVKATLAYDTE